MLGDGAERRKAGRSDGEIAADKGADAVHGAPISGTPIGQFAMPLLVAAGALAAIRHLRESRAERERHQERVAAVKRRLGEAGLPLMPSTRHIVPVLVGDALRRTASDLLLRHHQIYVQPIDYPTVPRGTERLRLTPTPYTVTKTSTCSSPRFEDVWQLLQIRGTDSPRPNFALHGASVPAVRSRAPSVRLHA